jgi:hypothetical protein
VTFSSTDLLCFSTNRNNGDLTQKWNFELN